MIDKPSPVYPAMAMAARASGSMRVYVSVDEEGRVILAYAVSGHPLLQDAAVKAAQRARFAPALIDGRPVKATGVISYAFKLPS